jgi:hypothetical protein
VEDFQGWFDYVLFLAFSDNSDGVTLPLSRRRRFYLELRRESTRESRAVALVAVKAYSEPASDSGNFYMFLAFS